MTATAARIGFITEQFRRVVSETTSVSTRHGDLARESEDPIETFFDDVDDAQLVADARQTLLSPERRRFTVRVRGVSEAMGLDYVAGTIPLADFVDTERAADFTGLIGEIGIDFERQQAQFSIWG